MPPETPGGGAKHCSACRRPKPLDQFCRNRHSTDGRNYRCRTCCRIAQGIWRENNQELAPAIGRANSRRYYAQNRERERRRSLGPGHLVFPGECLHPSAGDVPAAGERMNEPEYPEGFYQPDEAAQALIEAGRVYPGARVCESEPQPLLMRLAAEHAAYQAEHRRQGHQGFQGRYERITAAGLGPSAEICAESWPWQDSEGLEALGAEMFRSWGHSPGHWRVASAPHRWFGAGMARGSNGIWYSCILVARGAEE